MKYLILLICFVLISAPLAHAQDQPETYDRIVLKKGGILRGEILSFDEEDGDITFKDEYGRMYSLTREDYKYFEEDQPYKKKRRERTQGQDSAQVKVRKADAWALQMGVGASYLNLAESLRADDYFLGREKVLNDLPLSLKASVGKYLNAQNYVGITVDYALLAESPSFWNTGLRYAYIFNTKRNSSVYVPVELMLSQWITEDQYDIDDTTFVGSSGGFEYPASEQLQSKIHALMLNAGVGYSFLFADKKAFNIELTFFLTGILNEELVDLDRVADRDVQVNGLRLSLMVDL
ncbi:MAG: hypothetical protein AAFQ83_06580 [Bacteroidota bacterium]